MGSNNNRKVAVITGASSGIGKAAAALLLAQGWHVIGHGRDAQRTAAAGEELAAAAPPGARIDMLRADLSLLSDAARLAGEIAALTPRIDALLLNAGGVRAEKLITSEGHEATFSGNHLGHFLLTRELMPQLRAAVSATGEAKVPARVIATSSSGHLASPPFNWSDPQMLEDWTSAPAYCRVKLYNILFARQLARRGASEHIIAHAMHPGRVASNFASHGDAAMQAYMAANELDPPELSAKTLAFLAADLAAAATTGRYWFNSAEMEPSAMAQDDAAAQHLWEESERLIARAGF
jgi:NAD(P)-dependent dehydrogenase (short-subunit alcohol dehydrogenase family)